MGEVVNWSHPTRLDIPPERVLNAALEVGLTEVVIIGFDKDGGWYFASSTGDSADTIWHCTKAIHRLHKIEDEMSEG